MSQMSQKTNQFNLTTKRYTESDIKKFINDKKIKIFAFSVSDKFGDNGITGLAIIDIDYDKKEAIFDTFLMSCRIIGRNVEYAFMDYIISILKNKNINSIKGEYIRTLKNEQVSNYFDECNFELIEESNSSKSYLLQINKYSSFDIKYIRAINEKKN